MGVSREESFAPTAYNKPEENKYTVSALKCRPGLDYGAMPGSYKGWRTLQRPSLTLKYQIVFLVELMTDLTHVALSGTRHPA